MLSVTTIGEFEPNQTRVSLSELNDKDIIENLHQGLVAFNDLPEHLKTIENAISVTDIYGFQPGISKEFQEDSRVYENMCKHTDKTLELYYISDVIYKRLTKIFQNPADVQLINIDNSIVDIGSFKLDNFYGKYLDELSESFILYIKMRS